MPRCVRSKRRRLLNSALSFDRTLRPRLLLIRTAARWVRRYTRGVSPACSRALTAFRSAPPASGVRCHTSGATDGEAVPGPKQTLITRNSHSQWSFPRIGDVRALRSSHNERRSRRDRPLPAPSRDLSTKDILPGMDAALAAPRCAAADHLLRRRCADGGGVGGKACAELAASQRRLAASPPCLSSRQGAGADRRGRTAVAASPPNVASSSYLR
jgi:hypothetical protein